MRPALPHEMRQPGWFVLDKLEAKSLIEPLRLVGVRLTKDGKNWLVHRSHLPLTDAVDAQRLLTTQVASDWGARDRVTEALGFKLRTTQHSAVDYIEPRRGTLLGDDMRLGKGHPIGTCVLTPRGWLPVETLNVKDQVIGSNGRPCNVTGIFRRGTLPVFEVKFSDGSSVKVDGDHLWSVWDHNAWHRGKPTKVVETRKLIGNLTYGNHGNLKWRIPLVAPIEFGARDLRLDPYVLGVLLGDGSLSNGSITFCTGDDLVPAEVGRLLPNDVRLVKRTSTDRTDAWRISRRDDSNSVLDELKALGLMGLRSERKFVPASYVFGSVSQRLALLQGLMDTDGELDFQRNRQHVGFSSSSKALADAVKFLVESLGGVAREGLKQTPRYSYQGETRIGLPSYRLTIAMPRGLSPFRMRPGYLDRSKFQAARLISEINPVGEAEIICISVDAPDQLYVTEHCIVTHNTVTCLMAHDPARGPLVIVAPLAARAVWLGWIRRVFPGVPISALTGKTIDPQALKHPIIFIHYDIVNRWQALVKIGTLVLDEAHALVNKDSKRSRAVALLATMAEKVIAATGTPIWDLPADLWNVVGMLAPGAWGSYWDFGRRYGAPEETGYGVKFTGISNKTELNARLSEIMIRRLWKDVQQDLPPISRNVVVADVDDGTRRRLDVIAAKLRTERSNTASNLASYRSQLCTVKLKTVLAEAKQMMARGEPVVIWTWHKHFAESLVEQLEDSYLIHGEIRADEREARMDAWRAKPNAALVATMAVGQVAIDLSHSRLAIFAEIDYTPAILGQAEMRTFSPDRPMNVTFVVANHVADQRIVRALVGKLSASDPLGLGAAIDAIDALREAIDGPKDEPDMQRFFDDLIASMD